MYMVMVSVHAASLTLSTGQTNYVPGNTLSLSATLVPDVDAGMATDLYVAVVTPGGDILTLDANGAWSAALAPILSGIPLSSLSAPNFYVAPLSSSLASGEYVFALVAVATGGNPLDSRTWLGFASATVAFASGSAGNVALTTIGGVCHVGQACDVPLVAGVSGGSPPYHYQQDSFAYGLRPLNTNIDLLTGNLVGTPSVAGSYTFNLCAVDLGGNQDCRPVTVIVEESQTTDTARVFIGGDVSTLTEVTLDGAVIKDTSSQNLSYYVELGTGDHTLSFYCSSTYCFAYVSIEAPSGYTVSPASIDLTPSVLTPGTLRTYTLSLSR
jgi:hypothetical protein